MQEEKRLIGELERWSNIEENIWQQKSRIDWLKKGDSNARFFHASVKVRQSVNVICKLVRADDSYCIGQEQIREEVIEFYRRLMGTTAMELPMVDKRIVNNGPRLNAEQQQALNAPCSGQEVNEALFSMNSHKSPGIDGFNVFFFKKCWQVIGEEVVAAIHQFFLTGILPRQINLTLVILVPKCPNACVVKDFRPIACCTVLYKIISKVLANRMKRVLDTVISEHQSAFVPGRLIFDNIMLSQELIKGYTRKQISPRCMVKVDIQKAYDSVEWVFLQQMLSELGFPHRYIC